MKKKVINLLIIILVIIIVGGLLFFSNKGNDEKILKEITPEEEISEDQERKTMILLYFKDKQTGELSKEIRIIDVKKLTENPYKILVEMLMEGAENENLETIIPLGTKINDIYIKGDIVYIDFTKEFIENHIGGLDNENITIYSIVNTLTELNEVNFVKILIEGEEGKAFKDGNMNFIEPFERNN